MAKGRKKGTLFGKPQRNVIKRPGRIKRAAARAGISVSRYCSKSRRGYKRLPTSMKRACALARRMRTWH